MTKEAIQIALMQLLRAIQDGDYDTYKQLTSVNLTCFEPETQGHPVDGLPFHQFFIEHSQSKGPYHIELSKPDIKVFGDTAYAAYTLLVNRIVDGKPTVRSVQETRIFHKFEEGWKMVHFHRS